MTDWIIPELYRKPTPNKYDLDYKPEYIQPIEAIVYHYTASINFNGTLSWLCDPTSKASATFLVDRDGTKYQLAPLTARTWHAGGKTSKLFGDSNVNGRTIGIEIMNVGPLVKNGDFIFSIAENRKFDGPGICISGSRYKYTFWEAYPPNQIEAIIELTRLLINEFPILKDGLAQRLIGHEDVDPTRKTDPGPAWDWEIFRNSVVV